jgi:tetratricopeptide (TPR) repeat protein
MSVQMIARAIALVCVSSGVAFAAPAARTECPGCVASPAMDSTHELVVRRARVALREGEWMRAADLWRNALLMNERVADHWMAMGDALSGGGRYREAVAAYQRSIQLDPRVTRESTRRVARAFALMGNDKQAVRWLEQSLRAGVRPAELWADEAFVRYRGEARLRTMLEQKVELRGRALRGRGGVVV